jgi:hypothetical protein
VASVVIPQATLLSTNGSARRLLNILLSQWALGTTWISAMDALPDFLKLRILNAIPTARLTPEEKLLPPVDLSAAQQGVEHATQWPKSALQSLCKTGVAVHDGLVGADVACGVREEILRFQQEGRMKRAGMKAESETYTDSTYRGDLHMWISNIALDDERHQAAMPCIMTLLRKMHAMASELVQLAPAFSFR